MIISNLSSHSRWLWKRLVLIHTDAIITLWKLKAINLVASAIII